MGTGLSTHASMGVMGTGVGCFHLTRCQTCARRCGSAGLMGVMAVCLVSNNLCMRTDRSHYGPVALPPVPSPGRPSCTDSCKTQLSFLPTLTLPLCHLHPCYVWPPASTSQFSCAAALSAWPPLAFLPVTGDLLQSCSPGHPFFSPAALAVSPGGCALACPASGRLRRFWTFTRPTYYPSCLPGPPHALSLTPSSPGCPLPLPAALAVSPSRSDGCTLACTASGHLHHLWTLARLSHYPSHPPGVPHALSYDLSLTWPPPAWERNP
jgi:hypothetical protein